MEEFFEQIDLLNSSLEKYKNNKNKLISTLPKLTIDQKQDMNNIVNKLNIINNKISEITDDMEILQYEIDKNEFTKTDEIKKRMTDYEINKKVYDTFLPFMLYYNTLLNICENSVS